MKIRKVLLSLLVVLGLVGYAVYQRFGGDLDDDVPKLGLPSNTTMNMGMQNSSSVSGMGMAMQKPGIYKDGEYTGTSMFAYYGNVQVLAVIKDGRITDVKFLQYPNDRRTSVEISNQVMPLLKTEAIAVQNANVDVISGATHTSTGFRESLASALAKAK